MPDVKPIPEGMHTLTPHLTVQGADQAITFYQRAFGAKVQGRFADPKGLVMHASLRIGDSSLFLNDEFPGVENATLSPKGYGGTPVTLTLYVPDADAVFQTAIQAGAKVTMPLADMFWGDRYGVLQDPFGHLWAIATHKENVTPEEMERRGREAMAQMAAAKR